MKGALTDTVRRCGMVVQRFSNSNIQYIYIYIWMKHNTLPFVSQHIQLGYILCTTSY